MRRVVPDLEWTAATAADLMAIVDYNSDDNVDAAFALMDELERKSSDIPSQPRRGRSDGSRECVNWLFDQFTSSSLQRAQLS